MLQEIESTHGAKMSNRRVVTVIMKPWMIRHLRWALTWDGKYNKI